MGVDCAVVLAGTRALCAVAWQPEAIFGHVCTRSTPQTCKYTASTSARTDSAKNSALLGDVVA